MASTLWVGTRKGLFALRGNEGRRDWKFVGPPAFRRFLEGEVPKAVGAVFWLTAGHASEPAR